MTIHTEQNTVVFEETHTFVVKFAIDTILSPPYISDIWERPPAEGRSRLSPAHFLGSCAKGKNGDPRWGDGQGSCKLQGDWSKLRFEVTTRPLIGSLFSVRDFKQTISERGLLFLCF